MKLLFKKYIWLLDTIYHSHGITLKKINEKWLRCPLSEGMEIPRRTFIDWKNNIEDTFDVNIECDSSYRYYIEDFEGLNSSNVKQWMVNALSLNNLFSEYSALEERIIYEEVPSGNMYMKIMIEAMTQGRTVMMEYLGFGYEEVYKKEVKPYALKAFKRRWYVLVCTIPNNNIRVFALDRMVNLTVTDKKFKMPKNFKPAKYFQDSYGIFHGDGEPCDIKIKADKRLSAYLRTLYLHKSQKEIETGEDYAIFQYHLYPTLDFKQELIAQMSELEVLEPEWFRKEISNEIKNMMELYK